MDSITGHRSYMWLIAALAVALMFTGYGWGWALGFALLACTAVFAAVLWFIVGSKRSIPQSDDRQDASDRV